MNILSEYTYFHISKNIISYTFLLVFEIAESLQCLFNLIFKFFMVIAIFRDHGDGEICVMTWFTFAYYDIMVSLPIHLGFSVRLAIWEHTFCGKKPIEQCDTLLRLLLTFLFLQNGTHFNIPNWAKFMGIQQCW